MLIDDHDLLERARAEISPLSPLAAELVKRFAEDLEQHDCDAAEFERPEPLSVDVAPRPTA